MRRKGWAPVGKPALVHEMFSQDGINRSLLCVADKDGFVIDSCKLVAGGVDDAKFYKWARRYLAPIVRGRIVILDNAVRTPPALPACAYACVIGAGYRAGHSPPTRVLGIDEELGGDSLLPRAVLARYVRNRTRCALWVLLPSPNCVGSG
jgi:hypothetical protein